MPENLILFAFISVFLPFVLTAVCLLGLGLYILISPKTRSLIFVHKGRSMFIVFTLYTVFVALFFKNYLGIGCSVAFFLIIVISYYARSVMTESIFEKGLDICCYMAIPITVLAIVEKILNSADADYRCKLWFFNENYFCSIMAAVILACAFKATSHKKDSVIIYYICALFAAVSMYLGESLFTFVELFIGIFMLLILMKKHGLLAFFILMFTATLVVLYLVPEIFPRLLETNITSERRVRIWNEAMQFIRENPFFGRGFLSYHQLTKGVPGLYQTQHAHNFAIEGLISFGLVGSSLLIVFLWSYYQKVSECKALLRNNCATTFILTLSAAVLVHMTTDMTLLWIQTGLLYALVLGGLGADEKALHKRLVACAAKNDNNNTSSEE